MDFFNILFLAIIQGITEFLPISSSAHLVLAGEFFHITGQTIFSDIAMHLGTVLAVLVFYFKPLLSMGKNLIGAKEKNDFANPKIIWLLIISLIPTGIGGFLLTDLVEAHARSIFWIGINSIIFGGILFFADKSEDKKTISSMTWKEAIAVGVAQILAVFPGVSRAGITITALRFLGFNRESSVYYSVLLSVPTILGASLLLLKESVHIDFFTMFWSVLFSFVFTYICLKFLVKWIQKSNFDVFVYYRIGLGILLLTFVIF